LQRPEATGYGVIYFAEHVLHDCGETIKGKTCVISGSGNVALFAAKKLIELEAKVLTLSDSDGTIVEPDGLNMEQWEFIYRLKMEKRKRLSEYKEHSKSAEYHEKARPWGIVKAEIAIRNINLMLF